MKSTGLDDGGGRRGRPLARHGVGAAAPRRDAQGGLPLRISDRPGEKWPWAPHLATLAAEHALALHPDDDARMYGQAFLCQREPEPPAGNGG